MKNLGFLDAGTSAGTGGTDEGETIDVDAHGYLKSVYQNPLQPTSVRMKAAIEALEVEKPRLKATAVGLYDGNDFASKLEQAILRSEGKALPAPKVIEHSPAELREPPRLPDKRFRRV